MAFVRVSTHSEHGRPYESLKGVVAQAQTEWAKVVSSLKPQYPGEATPNSSPSPHQEPVRP